MTKTACSSESVIPSGALYCTKDVGHRGKHSFRSSDLSSERFAKHPFPRRRRLSFAGDCPPVPEWDLHETQEKEKQVLGCYVSGHPLDRYGSKVRELMVTDTVRLRGLPAWTPVAVAGTVSNYYERNLRKSYGAGNIVSFFELTDRTGVVRTKMNALGIERFARLAQDGALVFVIGRVTFYPTVDVDTDLEPTLSLMNMTWLSDEVARVTTRVVLRLTDYRIEDIEFLRSFLAGISGPCPVDIVLPSPEGSATIRLPEQISPSSAFFSGVEKLFGRTLTMELK